MSRGVVRKRAALLGPLDSEARSATPGHEAGGGGPRSEVGDQAGLPSGRIVVVLVPVVVVVVVVVVLDFDFDFDFAIACSACRLDLRAPGS